MKGPISPPINLDGENNWREWILNLRGTGPGTDTTGAKSRFCGLVTNRKKLPPSCLKTHGHVLSLPPRKRTPSIIILGVYQRDKQFFNKKLNRDHEQL